MLLSFPSFQGYINTGSPEAAFRVHDKMSRQGLQPDKLTYNTLILAAVKMENLDSAVKFLEEMKVSRKYQKNSLEPQYYSSPNNTDQLLIPPMFVFAGCCMQVQF